MKFNELLFEMPLPRSWDSLIFDSSVPFSKRVAYAKERAKQIGSGSSRIAFEINYKGQPTILKIAKNRKGLIQNEVESRALEDWYLNKLGLFIPIIDYDQQNDPPQWIHTRKAQKATNNDFVRYAGADLQNVIKFALNLSGIEPTQYKVVSKKPLNPDNPLIAGLADFFGNYPHIPWREFQSLRNWGVYKRRPVIIDMGWDKSVRDFYYKS